MWCQKLPENVPLHLAFSVPALESPSVVELWQPEIENLHQWASADGTRFNFSAVHGNNEVVVCYGGLLWPRRKGVDGESLHVAAVVSFFFFRRHLWSSLSVMGLVMSVRLWSFCGARSRLGVSCVIRSPPVATVCPYHTQAAMVLSSEPIRLFYLEIYSYVCSAGHRHPAICGCLESLWWGAEIAAYHS